MQLKRMSAVLGGTVLESSMIRYLIVRTTAFIVLTAASTAVLALPHIAS